jgi:hypothetical protein
MWNFGFTHHIEILYLGLVIMQIVLYLGFNFKAWVVH